MELIKGKYYTKEDFGIGFPRQFGGIFDINGEIYTFFTMGENSLGKKYDDFPMDDGFVYEGRDDSQLIAYGVQRSGHYQIFTRNFFMGLFTYIGKGCREERYDDTHNKIFFETP
ncbi:MAG: hypothetical protein LBP71_03195 [Spirochaetaceae bacterium]|nr:hypothetical protein [Spirochaetaceae bacterium]